MNRYKSFERLVSFGAGKIQLETDNLDERLGQLIWSYTDELVAFNIYERGIEASFPKTVRIDLGQVSRIESLLNPEVLVNPKHDFLDLIFDLNSGERIPISVPLRFYSTFTIAVADLWRAQNRRTST